MKKCDVIIPIYNAPQWVKLCVYSLFKNTEIEILNKVILIDDCSNETTKDLIKNIQEKYGKKIEVITNKENMGFVKNCNNGFKKSTADYVLLLNTDCLLTKNTIQKLINHVENNPKIGLICPISSNAANLSLDMFEGFNFSQMNNLLENKFLGMNFDACTIVGNCLLISKQCLQSVGNLDEIYGFGYGEETDYQFKAMEKGFEAKVAIDTYVFHKAEVSFGISKEKQEKLDKNREIFFERWEESYNTLYHKYQKNDPIEFIKKSLTEVDKKINVDTLFYLPDIVQNAGGVHMVIDMINYLSINGLSCNVLYNNVSNYQEIMLFNPIKIDLIDKLETKKIVSTIFASTFIAKEIAQKKNIPLLSFVQGYEVLFENGGVYGITELSYKISDYILSISEYLKKELKNNFMKDSQIINNGINYDLIHKKNNTKKPKTIAIILRNNVMKGDWILLDIIKKITQKFKNLTLNVIYMNEYIEFPSNENNSIIINKFLGPLNREKVSEILKSSDIYIDASLNEGFGLMALEAMAAGCVPIVSNSFGILDYINDNKNAFIINEVNNSDKYIDVIENIINNPDIYEKIKKAAELTSKKFDYDDTVEEYIKYFNSEFLIKTKDVVLTEKDIKIINATKGNNATKEKIKRKAYYLAKVIPKPIKQKLKKIITYAYNTFQH